MVSAYEYPNLINVSMAALLYSKLYMRSSHDLVLVQDHHRIPRRLGERLHLAKAVDVVAQERSVLLDDHHRLLA